MKKLLLATLCLAAITSGAQVIYSEDFEGADPLASMTLHGTDGATVATDATLNGMGLTGTTVWVIGDNPGSNSAMTTSWFSPVVPADNYMITPSITFEAGQRYRLSWFAESLGSASYLDPYKVSISTTGTAKEDFTTLFTNGAGAPNTDGEEISIIIPAEYSGEDVHIAFVATGEDDYVLTFDDISVEQLDPYDIELVSVNTPTIVEAGMIDIEGTVINNGANPITSFDVDWNDGTSHSATITASIEPGETYNFVHPTQLTGADGVTYDMTVCATVVDDADASNNCTDASVSAAAEIPQKYVVGEEKTGTWCGWCPRGAVALEDMESEDYFIGIAVHNGDPMTVAAYDSGINTYIPGGYPGGGVDRVIPGDPSNFSAMHSLRSTMLPPASVTVEYEAGETTIDVTVTGDFVVGLDGDYRLAAVITEDNVTGTGSGYAQANYYSGGGAGAMGGYEDLANPVPAADMVYDHVARALGNNQILGSTGSLPGTITAGSSESHTYTFPISDEWNLNKLHYIGMLVNGETGEILNAGITHAIVDDSGLEENASDFDVKVFPNPASDVSYVQVAIAETANVTVEIYNSLGAIVYSENTQNLSQGTYNYTVNVSDLSSGIYTVRTIVNSTVKTEKLSIK